MTYTALLLDIRDGVARITLNRPTAFNALDAAMATDLDAAVRACAESRARVVVLTGAGQAFCGGGDLKSFKAAGPEVGARVGEVLEPLHAAIEGIAQMDAPVIAAVNGVAAGAGLSLVCACDLAIATASARFTLAYTAVGLTPDGSSTYYLPRRVGLARALDMAITNRSLTATEAEAWGLVTRVVPDADFEREAQSLAERLAAGPTHSYGEAKRLIRAGWETGLREQMRREAATIAEVAGAADAQEGMSAFIEKRPPRFTGE